ncbi:MAG TPA: YncE family protein [Acidobacteriaceae bacterium]
MRTEFRMAALWLGLLAAFNAPQLTAQTHWDVTNTMHIGGEGSWDYVTTDPATHRLFVTRSTHTQVLDEQTGKVLGDIPGQVRSHGVAIVPKLNRGFITDGGGTGAIVVFDLKTYAVLGKLAALPDSDGIIYDATQDRVLAVSGDVNALMVIKPDMDPNGKIDTPIQLGGAPEFLATDGSGKVFVNLEDKDMVAVVDLKTNKVTARWPVAPGGHPVGMSLDAADHLIFIGCRKPQMLVAMNTETGKVEASLPIGAGVDATAFWNGQAFASTGDGAITVAGKQNGAWAVLQTVKTPAGARTMTADPGSHKLFLPTAEMEAATAGGRPRPKPDSFMIVVVEQK